GAGIAGVVQNNATTVVLSEGGPVMSLAASNLVATNSLVVGKSAAAQATNGLEVFGLTNALPVFKVVNTNTGLLGLNSVLIGGNKLIQGFAGAAGTTSEFDIDSSGNGTFNGFLSSAGILASSSSQGIRAAATAPIYWNGGSQMKSSADARIS